MLQIPTNFKAVFVHYYFLSIKYHIPVFMTILFCQLFTYISNNFHALFQNLHSFFSFRDFFPWFANLIFVLYDFKTNVKFLVKNTILPYKKEVRIFPTSFLYKCQLQNGFLFAVSYYIRTNLFFVCLFQLCLKKTDAFVFFKAFFLKLCNLLF